MIFTLHLQKTSVNCSSTSIDPFYPALERGEVKAGQVIILRYQGPKGAPGMPEVSNNSMMYNKP